VSKEYGSAAAAKRSVELATFTNVQVCGVNGAAVLLQPTQLAGSSLSQLNYFPLCHFICIGGEDVTQGTFASSVCTPPMAMAMASLTRPNQQTETHPHRPLCVANPRKTIEKIRYVPSSR
jgi:hypothetical protein